MTGKELKERVLNIPDDAMVYRERDGWRRDYDGDWVVECDASGKVTAILISY